MVALTRRRVFIRCITLERLRDLIDGIFLGAKALGIWFAYFIPPSTPLVLWKEWLCAFCLT
jgi:hypothetical protein